MKIFLDCEFSGLHQKTKLISLGAVTEEGTEFYAELPQSTYCYCNIADEHWIAENVVPHLKMQDRTKFCIEGRLYYNTLVYGNQNVVKGAFENWIKPYPRVQIISDCLSYDWVLFNDLWGHAFNLPEKINYIPLDLSTLLHAVGVDPDINREEYSELDLANAEKHSAIWDAKVIKACWERATASLEYLRI